MPDNATLEIDELCEIVREQYLHYIEIERAANGAEPWPSFREALIRILAASFGSPDEDFRDLAGLRFSGAGTSDRRLFAGIVETVRVEFDPVTDWELFTDRVFDEVAATRSWWPSGAQQ